MSRSSKSASMMALNYIQLLNQLTENKQTCIELVTCRSLSSAMVHSCGVGIWRFEVQNFARYGPHAPCVLLRWENGNVAQALGLFLIPPGCFQDHCSILPLVSSAVLALLLSSLLVHDCSTPGGQTEAARCQVARVFIFPPFPILL